MKLKKMLSILQIFIFSYFTGRDEQHPLDHPGPARKQQTGSAADRPQQTHIHAGRLFAVGAQTGNNKVRISG